MAGGLLASSRAIVGRRGFRTARAARQYTLKERNRREVVNDPATRRPQLHNISQSKSGSPNRKPIASIKLGESEFSQLHIPLGDVIRAEI